LTRSGRYLTSNDSALVSSLSAACWRWAPFGLGLVISTLISSYITGTATGLNLGILGRLAGYLIAVALDVGLFLLAFRLLTARTVSTREVMPVRCSQGWMFWVLQQLSALIISRYLHSVEATYGTFATVITMLWWFYLQSIVTSSVHSSRSS